MKKLLFILIAIITSGHEFAFTQETEADSSQTTLSEKDIHNISNNIKCEENYKLYPTQNIWTFLKLDTRTGKVWQVQYSVNSDSYGEVEISGLDLTFGITDNASRFELYPTQNMYNFILLDKKNGLVAQIQWSMDDDKRGLVHIISFGH